MKGIIFVAILGVVLTFNFVEGQSERKTGKVKWFNASKGYGFITQDDGSGEIFAQQTAIQMDGYRTLDEGARVSYVVVEGPKGFQATDIRPYEPNSAE